MNSTGDFVTPNCTNPNTEFLPQYLARVIVGYTLFFIAIVGNVLTLIPLVANIKRMPIYSYIINLCASNIVFAFFIMFQDATWHMTVQWYFGNIPCKMCQYLKQFSMSWNSFAVFVVGLERTISLLKPMAVNSHSKRAVMLIVPSIVLAFIGCLPSAWIFKLYDGPVCQLARFRQCVDFTSNVTVEFRNAYHLFFVAFQFIVPTIGTIICYGLLIREVTSMVRNEETTRGRPNGGRKSTTSVKRAKKKLELMAIYIVTTFLACYTVYYISQLIQNRMKEHEKIQYSFLNVLQFSTLYLAPAIYPVIFGLMLKDVRAFLKQIKEAIFPIYQQQKKLDDSPRMHTMQTMATSITSRDGTPVGTPDPLRRGMVENRSEVSITRHLLSPAPPESPTPDRH